jgi:S-methylmethionine-dependent homocysteine/selenocysteine methylase
MDLATFLASQSVILFDGAMGTQLAQRGLDMGGQNNLTNPDHVLDIHQQYIQSGSSPSPEMNRKVKGTLSTGEKRREEKSAIQDATARADCDGKA